MRRNPNWREEIGHALGIVVVFAFIALIFLFVAKECSAQTTINLPTKWGSLIVVLPANIIPIDDRPHVFFSLTPHKATEINEDTCYIRDESLAGTAILFMDSYIPQVKGLMLITHTNQHKYWVYIRGLPQSVRTDELGFWASVEVDEKDFWKVFKTKEAI